MTEQATETIAQSRIGKRLLTLPAGVELKVAGRDVTVKGPKGSMSRVLPPGVKITIEGPKVTVLPEASAGRDGKKYQGLVRALLGSMVEGAAKGYATSLDFYGVGYRAEVKGSELHMALGLLHEAAKTL
jgi:large subunit ribosomal protein L6